MSSKNTSIQKVFYPTTRPSSSTTSKSTGTKLPTMDKIFGRKIKREEKEKEKEEDGTQ